MDTADAGSDTHHNNEDYESSPFDKRIEQGLQIDRSMENSMAQTNMKMIQAAATKDSEIFLEMVEALKYRNFRDLNSWHTKRQVNAMLVDSTRSHEQIIGLARPVLLDIFMQVQPTARDWKRLSEINAADNADQDISNSKIHEKSARRIKDYFPNVVGKFTGPSLLIRKEDGTFDAYPKWPQRENPKKDDRRLESIATHYSLPPRRGKLDTKDFADANYLIRLKKFWRGMLLILSELLENYGPIRKEMEWLIYHIVNNDVALYVLFDDLSLEYESRWFAKLSEDKKMLVAGIPGLDSEPYFFTKNHAKQGISELKKFISEFENVQMPATLLKYKVSPQTMKRRILELAREAVDGYEYSRNYQPAAYILEEILNQELAIDKLERMLYVVKLSIIYSLICCSLADYPDNSKEAAMWLHESGKLLMALTNGQYQL